VPSYAQSFGVQTPDKWRWLW